MRNSTIGKQLGFLKWFLRWATAKSYNTETAFQTFSPKLKTSEKKVVFLNWNELRDTLQSEIVELFASGKVVSAKFHSDMMERKDEIIMELRQEIADLRKILSNS